MTRIHSNKGVRTQDFKYQLTHWLPMLELRSVTALICKAEGRNSYGKAFVIKVCKEGGQKGKYAVFTKGEYISTDSYDLSKYED